jgi:RNA-binding protein YhbY
MPNYKPIVLITTDTGISIDLETSAEATIKIVAIGANGLTSTVVSKT